jgi:SAM-dependent methyltransferase
MSSAQDWDERFLSGDHASPKPDPFLAVSSKHWPLLPSRNSARNAQPTALDVACGAGRHSVALAEAGFDVTAIDFSAAGLRKGADLASQGGVAVDWMERDLESAGADFGESLYDLVAVFFFLHRPLFPALRRSLKPGGLLVYKTYSVDQLSNPGGPRRREYLLEPNELLRAFAGFRVLVYEEEWEGKGTASLIAQKP